MSQSNLFRAQYNGISENCGTESAAMTRGKELVSSGITERVEIYKLCKVVAVERRVTVTDPGVVPQGEICGNS